jgi:hypothetical protein
VQASATTEMAPTLSEPVGFNIKMNNNMLS